MTGIAYLVWIFANKIGLLSNNDGESSNFLLCMIKT